MGAEVEEQKTVNQEGLWSCSFFFSNIFPWCCVSRLKCNLKFRICGVVVLAFYKNTSFQSQFKAMLSENGKILLYKFCLWLCGSDLLLYTKEGG